MKISASVQAANQLNLLEDIENNKNNFDQLHHRRSFCRKHKYVI